MTYVFCQEASEIERKPTENELNIVLSQKRLMEEIYNRYIELYAGKQVSGIDAGLRDKLWSRYLKEQSRYNELFNTYLGYCY